MDLWFAPFQGPAVNLGSTLNTDGNEITPFYHSVEKSYISVLIFIEHWRL